MDIPVLSPSRLRTQGVTQPVVASTGVAAIAPESHPSGNPAKRDKGTGISHSRQGEEQVDISELARLLARRLR